MAYRYFFGSEDPPFTVEPTPEPTLPENMEQELRKAMEEEVRGAISGLQQLYALSQGQFDISSAMQAIKQAVDNTNKNLQERIKKLAKELAEKEKRHLDDQFTEGKFYNALDECLEDIGIFPCAFLKSCVPRTVTVFNKQRQVEKRVISTYNRVSPFDIYPSPYVSDFSDYVIEVLHLTPHDLLSLRGIPSYVDKNIEEVVGLYGDSGYSVSSLYSTQINVLEGKDELGNYLIDVIEFWGTVKGELIKEYLPSLDSDEYYDVTIWVCDNKILKAALNPDPLGIKPYHKASFITIPNSFWGMSLIDVLYDLQEGVNALSRAIINNAVLSSGPMIERNVDRVPEYEDASVTPWRIFNASGIGYDTSPAYRFYQPNVTSVAVMQVVNYYMKMADELSGVPSYAHGNITGGSVGARTSSGLSMLMANANRGIKEVVKNIDKGLIEPVVERQYNFNIINYYGESEEMPDLQIRAKGSTFLMEKLSQTQRMLELLQLTNNPVDLQLVGIEGRKYLLDHIFQNFGVPAPKVDELDAIKDKIQQSLEAAIAGGQGTGVKGNAVSNEETVSAPPKDQNPQPPMNQVMGGI